MSGRTVSVWGRRCPNITRCFCLLNQLNSIQLLMKKTCRGIESQWGTLTNYDDKILLIIDTCDGIPLLLLGKICLPHLVNVVCERPLNFLRMKKEIVTLGKILVIPAIVGHVEYPTGISRFRSLFLYLSFYFTTKCQLPMLSL